MSSRNSEELATKPIDDFLEDLGVDETTDDLFGLKAEQCFSKEIKLGHLASLLVAMQEQGRVRYQ